MSSYGTDAHCESVTSTEVFVRNRLNVKNVTAGPAAQPPQLGSVPAPEPFDLWFIHGNDGTGAGSFDATTNGVYIYIAGSTGAPFSPWVQVAQMN